MLGLNPMRLGVGLRKQGQVVCGWVLGFLLAISAQAVSPGTALRFDGVNGYVQVASAPALNAFPLTVTAWFRSTNGTSPVQSLVSKYVDSSGDGWSLILQNGHLRGFYFAGNAANRALDATSAAVVTDGFWHQAAMVVDNAGGRIFVDGIQVGFGLWTGTVGAPGSLAPLYIGRYSTLLNRFQGDIDEVTVWNRAMLAPELNYLKHRQLNGNEGGLVALWHFDENGGLTAGDASGHGNLGTLVNNPAWVPSSAPLVFNQVSSNALKFDGVAGYVSVPNTPDLSPYPFTATAWFRTTNAVGVQGIVSEYADSSANGWTLVVQGGHLRGFFYRNGSFFNYAIDATSPTVVSDGGWHHAALIVDAAGGRLLLDGSVVTASPWIGFAGPSSTTQPLQIGRYSTYANMFAGAIDEVTLWSRALANSEVQTLKNQLLVGNESGLVGYWRLDEGSGSTTADATGLGHTGNLVNNPAWTGSTALIGDGTSVAHTTLGAVQWARAFAVQTMPAERGFAASAPVWMRRLDDFGATSGPTNETVTLQCALTNVALATPVPLVNSATQMNFTLTPYLAAAPQPNAGGVYWSPLVDVEPSAGTQLDSVNDSFQLSVNESHSVNSGPVQNGETPTLAPAQLLHFNGNLAFGTVATRFTSIANSPARGALGGGGVNTQLAVNNNSGYLVAKPDHYYGDGSLNNVVLLSNGDAVAPAGLVQISGPVPDLDCVQNICFIRTNLTLSSAGVSGLVTLLLPSGFSVCTNFNETNRLTVASLNFPNTALDQNLDPQGGALVTPGPLYAIHEMLPYWLVASSLSWQAGAGSIALSPIGGAFVRQEEDDILTSLQPTLVEPSAANRISNDGYLRDAMLQTGSAVTVTADANGVALLTASLALNPPELRPHFPYAGSGAGGAMQTLPGGALVFTQGLIDTANSFINLNGAVPVTYARDCAETSKCSAGQIGPTTLPFTPNGANQLAFTPDGGLLSFGSVPVTSLTWGYVSGTHFAQSAGTVQAGAYCMAGTFLRYDQSALEPGQRPEVLLLSGFGDGSDPAYLERPGQSSYLSGFANYAGLNFRAPTTGQSYLATTDTGPYPLLSISKYYARFGGVSGLHQAASFPSKLNLYGYAFTFSSYGLSFLDSENWESRTDGAVAFPPQPAGFTQEFDRMTVTCRGDLASAQIPAGSGGKHLNYWNVDFTPQSLDFHPTNTDACATSTRFMVLGVETKLPFIPQALHASLGFKTNGNLVAPVDQVVNVDSRFPVPAHLSMRGPGNTVFTLSTAAEGYFNNWETPGRPDAGFYNLAGKLRVPFFSDIKVQLQVTPTSSTASDIEIMGGWPAADSTAADHGWSVNQSNFFNQVKFDPHSDGWPAAQSVSLADYRKSSTIQYRPRAQRVWIDVATFDYPLQWNGVLRRFEGFQDATVILPVIDVNSRLKELAPGKVDFDFAQDITLQLPRVKVLDFVNDALNGNIGPLITVSNAIRKELGAVFDVTGLNELSQTLSEEARGFFDPVLGPALDPLVNNVIFPQISALSQADRAAFLNNVYQIITQPAGQVMSAVNTINGGVGQANTVIGKLDRTLTDVENTAGLLERVLEKDNQGNRHVVRTIVEKLVQDQAPALGFVVSMTDAQLAPLLAEIEPTLAEIQSEILDVSNQVAEVHAGLGGAGGDFNQALSAALNDATAGADFLKNAAGTVTNFLASVLTVGGDYFTANPEAAKAALRQQLETAFLSSALPGNYQKTFRQFLADKDFLLDQLMDTLFDQINRTIRDGMSSLISGAQDGVFQNLKGAGLLSQSLLSARIRGAPTFQGDSLRRIHLDAAVQLNLPDKMNFNAYLDIKELNSQTVPVACVPAGAPAAEVTIGAKDVPLSWGGVDSGGTPLTLGLEARWTLQGGSVLGIGGLIDIKGEAGFKGCSIKEIAATLAIGQIENYFAAKAAGTISVLGIPVDVHAGLFAGHACSLDPLKFVDPEVDQVLNNPATFSGLYIEYGGGLSLSEILFGTSTCLLDVEASVTTALYYMGGPSLGSIGGRQKMAVDVSLLCLVSGHVDWAEFIQLSAGQLTVGGSANVCGSIGPCPFCVSGCKGITVKGVLTTGGIDYFIDY